MDQFFWPWSFPSLELDQLANTIKKLEMALTQGLASPQTASGELGFNYGIERKLINAAGQQGTASSQPVNGKNTGKKQVAPDAGSGQGDNGGTG